MIEVNEILQTMQMIHEQHFDIRTITMGISLLSCKKNTDRETAEATLHLDGHDYTLPIVRDRITVLTIRDGAAVVTTDWETVAEDVRRCGDGVEVTVTADEPSVLTVLADGQSREMPVPAGKATVQAAL